MGQEFILIRTHTYTDEFTFNSYEDTFFFPEELFYPDDTVVKGPILQALNSSRTHKLH